MTKSITQYTVKAIPIDKVVANSYNPNIVAPPEMKLLELSIWEDGYTMPCVLPVVVINKDKCYCNTMERQRFA